MKKLEVGDKLVLYSYKHDGKIHRYWDEALLLDVQEDYCVFGNDRTKVIESDGRTWKTKEAAILFFYKNSWYNVIAQLKKNGIFYYCNIASPFVIEDKTIKYIDYDLDLRVFPDGSFKILDRGEYKYHKKKMDYPEKIDYIVKKELSKLIEKAKKKELPFDKETIEKYYVQYKELKKKKEEL